MTKVGGFKKISVFLLRWIGVTVLADERTPVCRILAIEEAQWYCEFPRNAKEFI